MIGIKSWRTNGTREELISQIYDYLASKSNNIEKNNDSLKIFNKYTLKLDTSNAGQNYTRLELKNSEENQLFSNNMQVINTSWELKTGCDVCVAENSDCLLINFKSLAATSSEYDWQLIFIRLDDTILWGSQYKISGADAISEGLGVSDDTSKTISMATRIPYGFEEIRKNEIIKSKIFLQGENMYNKSTLMYDISNVSPHKVYTMNQKDYFAVNKNTLMEV